MTDTIAEIHEFWFGALDENGLCASDRNALWFGASAEVDATCRARFGPALVQARAEKLGSWTESDRGLVALVVLLDQLSRNIHRGTAEAFAGDALALRLAQNAISTARHLQLPLIHRVFLYLPLEHSEDLSMQEQCVALFAQLAHETGQPQFDNFARYAVAHRDVIARFGRFPHRNAILDRASSAEELNHIEQHGGF